MKYFQAKDIQKLVDIKKYRYDYIASKIGIKPEIDEVEKTGYHHLYSFKNLLEFAFVHKANNLGVTRKAAKEMLGFLSDNIELKEAGLFDPEKRNKALLHYADSNDGKIFQTKKRCGCTNRVFGIDHNDANIAELFIILNKRAYINLLVENLVRQFQVGL